MRKLTSNMPEKTYLIWHISLILPVILFFQYHVFHKIKGLNFMHSQLVGIFLLLLCFIGGYILTRHHARYPVCIMATASLPCTLYYLLSNGSIIKKYAFCLGILFLAGIILMNVVSMIKNMKKFKKNSNCAENEIIEVFVGKFANLKCSMIIDAIALWISIAAFLLSITTLCSVYGRIGLETISPGKGIPMMTVIDKPNFSDNVEVLCKFDENIWSDMTSEEKIECLKAVVEIETAHLENPFCIKIQIGNVPTGRGKYIFDERVLIIDEKAVENDSPVELIELIAKACRTETQMLLCSYYYYHEEEFEHALSYGLIQQFTEEMTEEYTDEELDLEYESERTTQDSTRYALRRSLLYRIAIGYEKTMGGRE